MSALARRTDDFLFELRVRLWGNLAIIRAYDRGVYAPNGDPWYSTRHTRLDLSLHFQGVELWPRGSTYIGIPGHESIDGDSAKATALSLFALKPGDTDAEFFEGYTPEQLAFVETHGDELTMVRMARFGEDS